MAERSNPESKQSRSLPVFDSKSGQHLPVPLVPNPIPILPVNHAVIYPTLMAPLLVSEPRFVSLVEELLENSESSKNSKMFGLLLSRSRKVDHEIQLDDLYQIGVLIKVLKRLKMPDGTVNLLVHSLKRFRVLNTVEKSPRLDVHVEYLEDIYEKSTQMDALNREVIGHVKRLADVNPFFTEEMRLAMLNAPGPGTVADLVAFSLSLSKEQSQEILETFSVKERFQKVLLHLKREQNVASLQKKIQEEVNSKINSMQRDFFLREQLKAIRKELGLEEEDRTRSHRTFKEKIELLGLPEDSQRVALEELKKFSVLPDQSPEYTIVRHYLETICALPWNHKSKELLSLKRARRILNEDHFGLEKVKERIIEFLAVRQLLQKDSSQNKKIKKNKKDKTSKTKKSKNAVLVQKGSILCLVGPPGVGKTSVGRSIARTLGRKFYRISLGGMRDEAEIKGHRRTYVGAMPGKIIQAFKRVQTKNPVIVLDEVDKLGISFQGDPASALLEVLDPEQNSAFVDHYLDLPFDLSETLFIATCNSLSGIPPALLDRMEAMEIPGYTIEEKLKIAKQYLLPKVIKEHGLHSNEIKIQNQALKTLIREYCREPGLRSLQQSLAQLCRKAATQLVEGKRKKRKLFVIRKEDLQSYLGMGRYYNEVSERISAPGVAVGLAWTPSGGDILFVEASELPGSGKLNVTGQMGGVMSESASIAWSYVKKQVAEEFGLTQKDFRNKEFHVHIPAGSIPKDGPSAGITMATALYSLLTGARSRQKLAMTGELTLTGKVLPVGGIKEKLLASRRAGIQTVILPKQNQKDIHEIPRSLLRGLKFHWVNHVQEVFKLATVNKKNPSSKKQPHP